MKDRWKILDNVLTVLIAADGLAIILLAVLIFTQVGENDVRRVFSRHNMTELSQQTDEGDAASPDTPVMDPADVAANQNTDPDAVPSDAEETADDGTVAITITATGDCTLGNAHIQSYDGSFDAYYDENGADYFFQHVRDYFTGDDLTIINLEGTLTNAQSAVDKEYNMKGRPEYTEIMTGSGVEFCSLGNNHTYDYGEEGLADTKAALLSAGLRYAYNDDSCIYKTESGITIGLVSVSLVSQGIERENLILDEIAELRTNPEVDLIIACPHWGEERVYFANNYQVDIGHKLVDAGADLVIGNHAHVLQTIELYEGRVILYSLGNFCFGGNKNPSDKECALYRQTFTFRDGTWSGELDAQIIPCMLSSHDGYNDFSPREATQTEAASIITKLKERSAGYSDIVIGDDGRITQ